MPKPKVIMSYFCIIPKTWHATSIVNYNRKSSKFIDFYWFPWNNLSQNSKTGWHQPPTILYLYANFKLQIYCTSWDTVYCVTSNHPPSHPDNHPMSSIWHHRDSAVLRSKILKVHQIQNCKIAQSQLKVLLQKCCSNFIVLAVFTPKMTQTGYWKYVQKTGIYSLLSNLLIQFSTDINLST